MTTITLPPLPPADEWPSIDQLRARDLEVARVVLEGAANVAAPKLMSYMNAAGQLREKIGNDIRALEVKHHE
jgi:hypothetical protein